MNSTGNFQASLHIPFPSRTLAEIAYDVLKVDSEPKKSKTVKSLMVKDHILDVGFTSTDLKNLRVAVNSFFDLLILVTKTMDMFGPPLSVTYDYY